MGDGALSGVFMDVGGLSSLDDLLSIEGFFDNPLDGDDGKLGLDSLVPLVDFPFDDKEESVLLPKPFELFFDLLPPLPFDAFNAFELFDPAFPLPLDKVLLDVAFNFFLLLSLLDPLFFCLTIL